MTDQLTQLLQRLADQFGVSVEYLWPLLVAYTRWVHLGALIVALLVVALSLGIVMKCVPALVENIRLYNHRDDTKYVTWSVHAGWAIAQGILSLVFAIIGLLVLTDIPGHLAAVIVPEARVLLDLLAKVGGK